MLSVSSLIKVTFSHLKLNLLNFIFFFSLIRPFWDDFFDYKTIWLLSSFFLWSSFPWSIRPSVDARRIWESFLNFKLSSGPVRKVKRNWRAKGARRALIRRERFWKGADWLSLGYVSPIHTAQKHLNHSPRWILGSKTKVTVGTGSQEFWLGLFFFEFCD